MVARVRTVAFQGIEAVPVDVQVMIAPGKMNIHIVGLPDKAVAESRERVQAALHASGLSLPAKKVTVNLAPADLPKEGSHLQEMCKGIQQDSVAAVRTLTARSPSR
jgi:magnesium chelatase family protein